MKNLPKDWRFNPTENTITGPTPTIWYNEGEFFASTNGRKNLVGPVDTLREAFKLLGIEVPR